MASPRIEYAVLPAGEGPGQDRCFTADGLVVVLDGASAIDPVANPDATEYVDTLGPLLIEQIMSTPGFDLRDALADAIRLTAHELALVPGTAPSSTVSIVRWGGKTVDVLVLGDSPVILQFTDGSEETIVQYSQDHIAPELRWLYRRRLAAGYGYDDVHQHILAHIQQAEAAVRNASGGYWIAEAAPSCGRYAKIFSCRRGYVRTCVLATDGAASVVRRVTEATGKIRREQLLSMLKEHALWERVHDPDGRQVPRSKACDDKAIACLFMD